MNLNKVILIGRATSKPELRKSQSGQSFTQFGLATNRNWTNKDGSKGEEVEFHNLASWGKTAEIICQFVDKGSLLMIEGHLKTRTWESNGEPRKSVNIVIESFQFGPRTGDKKVVEEEPPF